MNEELPKRWNLRVYGLLIEDGWILLSRESYPGFEGFMIKLPGGGMQLGEGPEEALTREMEEEVGLKVHSVEIVHIPASCHRSHFDNSQVVSLYYRVKRDSGQIPRHMNREVIRGETVYQEFYWCSLKELDAASMTWETDREVVEALLKSFEKDPGAFQGH